LGESALSLEMGKNVALSRKSREGKTKKGTYVLKNILTREKMRGGGGNKRCRGERRKGIPLFEGSKDGGEKGKCGFDRTARLIEGALGKKG